jgi:hypothetical protein
MFQVTPRIVLLQDASPAPSASRKLFCANPRYFHALKYTICGSPSDACSPATHSTSGCLLAVLTVSAPVTRDYPSEGFLVA